MSSQPCKAKDPANCRYHSASAAAQTTASFHKAEEGYAKAKKAFARAKKWTGESSEKTFAARNQLFNAMQEFKENQAEYDITPEGFAALTEEMNNTPGGAYGSPEHRKRHDLVSRHEGARHRMESIEKGYDVNSWFTSSWKTRATPEAELAANGPERTAQFNRARIS